jgi:26S proteasome regulatory subunit N2
MGSIGISSASGLLSLLEDEQDEVKSFALEKLNTVVDGFWSEIADSLQKMY